MCNYLLIRLREDNPSAEGFIIVRWGHRIGNGQYILDTDEDPRSIESMLRPEADVHSVESLTRSAFESLSREHLGFFSENPARF
jgi:hypothetical protein